jgi:hypothetical protein
LSDCVFLILNTVFLSILKRDFAIVWDYLSRSA